MIKCLAKTVKTILLISAIIVLVSFAISNKEFVEISLFPLPFELRIRIFLLIIFSVLLGILISILTLSAHSISDFFAKIRNKQKIEGLEKKIKILEKKETTKK